jgi:hypothetical protein
MRIRHLLEHSTFYFVYRPEDGRGKPMRLNIKEKSDKSESLRDLVLKALPEELNPGSNEAILLFLNFADLCDTVRTTQECFGGISYNSKSKKFRFTMRVKNGREYEEVFTVEGRNIEELNKEFSYYADK